MEYKPEEQVFAFDDSDDVDPAVMYKKMLEEQVVAGKSSAVSDINSSDQLSGVKRKFRADNGIHYIWDDEEDCWVVDEDDDGEDSESDNENEGYDDEHNIDLKYKQAMSEMSSKRMTHEDDHDLHGLPPNSSRMNKSDNSKNVSNDNSSSKTSKKKKSKKNKKTAPNNWIYITGLPKDITIEEIKSHFSKVGLIALSPIDQTDKIKLYKDEVGELKGDCSLCYHATESVEMAINFLDGGYIRPSHLIQVTKAAFETKKHDVLPTAGQPLLAGGGSTSTNESVSASSTSTTAASAITTTHRRPKVSHAQVKTIKSVVHQALSWSEDDDIGISKSSALKIIVLQGNVYYTLVYLSSAL